MTKQTLNYELLTLLNESMFFQLKNAIYPGYTFMKAQ